MYMLIIPTIIFAETEVKDTYTTLAGVSKALLSVLSWFGYAISMRNAYSYWNKIYGKHCKRKS